MRSILSTNRTGTKRGASIRTRKMESVRNLLLVLARPHPSYRCDRIKTNVHQGEMYVRPNDPAAAGTVDLHRLWSTDLVYNSRLNRDQPLGIRSAIVRNSRSRCSFHRQNIPFSPCTARGWSALFRGWKLEGDPRSIFPQNRVRLFGTNEIVATGRLAFSSE